MKIEKVFNNNTVATVSEDHTEMIVVGSGVGFQKHAGDTVDEKRIEKRYVIEDSQKSKLYQILERIPVEYFEISEIIFRKALKGFKGGLSSQIVLMLADHIAFAIQRHREQVQVPNLLLPEIQTLYPKEYRIGLWALKYIQLRTGIALSLDEAGFIAIHVINAAGDNQNAGEILSFCTDVMQIIESCLHQKLRANEFSYRRLSLHLRYLGQRIYSKHGEGLEEDFDPNMFDAMLKMNETTRRCLARIVDHVRNGYGYELNKAEQFYIMIHILKIVK